MSQATNPRRTTLWFLAILIVGAGLRFVALGSVPPGLHFDEAVYGTMANEIGGGFWPVFFRSYTGREPLYMYLMAAVFQITGATALGIRLTSAIIGTATLYCVYLLMRELWPERVPRAALLAAALMALSYWHITVSRNGYPNVLIPPIECVAMLYLWRGWRDRKPAALTLGGALVGLVLYTYLAARLFPVTVAAFFCYALLVDRPLYSKRVWGLALAALAAVVVFAPLGAHFARHPHDFWERADQVLAQRVATGPELFRLYGENALRTFLGLFWQGDPRQHFNLPGKPILTLPVFVLFLLGLAVVARRWRQPAYAVLPIWLVGMSLPALLTAEPMPQTQRMFGVTPALYAVPALGLDAALAWLERQRWLLVKRLATLAVVLLLIGEGVHSSVTYFGIWARQPATLAIYNGDYVAAAQEADRRLDAGDTVVLQSYHYKHATVAFVAPRTVTDPRAVWATGHRLFVVPRREAKSDVIYLRPQDNPARPAIAALEEQLTEALAPLCAPDGQPIVTVRRLRPTALPSVDETGLGGFADLLTVLDSRLPKTAARDVKLPILVQWRAESAPGEGYDLRVHLTDAQGVLWAQSAGGEYLSGQWQSGDLVYQLYEISLPRGIPAGTYTARLVLSHPDRGQIPAHRDGQTSGPSLILGQVKLIAEGAYLAELAPATPLGAELLAQADSGDHHLAPGATLQVSVTWWARSRPTRDYTATLALLDADGIVQHRVTMPLAGEYPTTAWQPGEIVRGVYPLTIPTLPDGTYCLHLTVTGTEGAMDLGSVLVEAPAAAQEPPPIAHPLRASLGETIALLGYALPAGPTYVPGDQLSLTLYWQAVATPDVDAKVFVHLLDEYEHILTQDDNVPAGWQRPTMGWRAGEVVVDTHTLAIPNDASPGHYKIAIGMYDAATLQRLPLHDADGIPAPEQRLILATITIAP